MKHLFMVFTYLVSLTNKFLKHNGMKAVVAENVLLKHQLFVLTRSRNRAPHLSSFDRFFLGLWSYGQKTHLTFHQSFYQSPQFPVNSLLLKSPVKV